MTFGCSRSPVTVAVPSSRRSILGADFGLAFAGARAAEVSARGSPASDCAVALVGFAEGVAVVASVAAGGDGGCAAARPAQTNAAQIKIFVLLILAPSL